MQQSKEPADIRALLQLTELCEENKGTAVVRGLHKLNMGIGW